MSFTDWIAWAGLAVALIAALFAALQWASAYRSAESAERSAKAAEKSLDLTREFAEVGQRPWVGHNEVKSSFSSPPTSDPKIITFALNCALFNSGQSPALNFRVGQELRIFDREIPDRLDYPVFGPESSFVPLPPNSVSNIPCRQDFLTREIEAVSAGDKVLCLFGRALYIDCFGKQHETRWCLYYDSRLPAFAYANKHNSMT